MHSAQIIQCTYCRYYYIQITKYNGLAGALHTRFDCCMDRYSSNIAQKKKKTLRAERYSTIYLYIPDLTTAWIDTGLISPIQGRFWFSSSSKNGLAGALYSYTRFDYCMDRHRSNIVHTGQILVLLQLKKWAGRGFI
jgi:hypothetical protein